MSSIRQSIRDIFGNSLGSAKEAAGTHSGHTEVGDRRRLVAPSDHLCAITDVGRVRPHNEDTFHISDDGQVLIVADGLGGHEAGEVASALAVTAVADFFGADCQQTIESGTTLIESLLLEAFEVAHRKVLEAGQSRVGCHGMGTTLILAYILGNRLHTCHVGDVRCYVRGAAGLEQITRDHSLVGALVQAGELTAEEARVHPRKNEILQAIGLPTGITPEVNSRGLRNGDRILLCSDGLWEALADDEICSILDAEGSIRQRATQLVDRANEAGGHDNITVLLYEHVLQKEHHDELA